MRARSICLSLTVAVAAFVARPVPGLAAINAGPPPLPAGNAGPPPLPAGDYYVSLQDGSYVVGTDPFAGGEIYIDPSLPGLDFADITLSGPPLLTFKNILSQSAGAGNEWDVTLEDTTNTYDMNLVLDDWSALLAGQDGAAIDPSTDVVEVADTSDVVATQFGGELAVPAPAALPVFATALAMLGAIRRRRNRTSIAA